MPVNYATPAASELFAVPGVRLGVAEAGIRKANRRDLTLIELAPGARAAGVFTQNRFCAAPVQLCREHLAQTSPRALVINTGIANAGTGEAGLQHARLTCEATAVLLGCEAQAVLPFSTGVILEPLPVDRLIAGLPAAQANLRADGWFDAAHAIMTTDTVAKAASRRVEIDGHTITLTGMAKGAGMIRPNMATMLGFVACDAAVSQPVLEAMTRAAVADSFNSITVDGDTSTNDSFIVLATGHSRLPEITRIDSPAARALQAALNGIAQELAQAIVRDGEGATKFITVQIEGGLSREECRQVGYAIAHSPLVKTAFFASDPNLGRILAAVGYAGVDNLDTARLRLWLGNPRESVLVCERGGIAANYREEDGARILKDAEPIIRIDLGRGTKEATLWTCDLSYDYVKINADYRS